MVGELRHRWGGVGVQRPPPALAGAAVAGRWNGMDACAMRRITVHRPAGRRTRGPGQPDVRGTSRVKEARARAGRRLAWLASVGAVAGARWVVAASGWRSSMGAASRDGSVRRHGPVGTWRSSPRCTDPGSVPTWLPAGDVPTRSSNAHSRCA